MGSTPPYDNTTPMTRPGIPSFGGALAAAATVAFLSACDADAGSDGRAAPGETGSRHAVLPAASVESPGAEPPVADGSGQPFLATEGDGVRMSWIEPQGSGHRVAAAFFDGDGWDSPATVAASDSFFVNWADFPSVQPVGGALVAHWLHRQGSGTYDYGVRLAWSADSGRAWTPAWTPHGDDTPTEHGFVSVFGDGEQTWAAWLDGRAMVEEGGAMALRARRIPVGGPASGSEEEVVDLRTCECCQTGGAIVDGVPLLVFRDRGEGEVRDVHVSRRTAAGWTESVPVHRDGWVFPGCPVNGPAVAALGRTVAVAWFTAPDGEARVNVAFSDDAGAEFGPPVRVDAGAPVGRVDVLMLDDGSALVSWIEGGAGAALLARRTTSDGAAGPARRLVALSEKRASGFPRLARLGRDHVMAAWTDASGPGRVRTAVFSLAEWESLP